ncbi:MAG: Uma2 family endonuclease [Planctomycetaceae bacterium]|nr:Uma2 family endonuclease [Planctomycetaceae bacterium]
MSIETRSRRQRADTTTAAPLAGPKPLSNPSSLRNGDRLTLSEFLRRYEAMPGIKAELIDGRVYLVLSPVRHEAHGKPHSRIIHWLATYEVGTPGTETGTESTLKLDLDNGPQPDVFLRLLPHCGGASRNTEDDYISGGPELIAEIASSSINYDLHDKFELYRRHGVKEYVVWRVEDRAIDWFVLCEGRYEPLIVSDDGVARSEVFPGLWLDLAALLSGDLAATIDTLRRGIDSPEHAAFVERLRSAKPPGDPGH